MEEKLIIQLNAVEIKNLKVFLSRVDLKGSEVYEFASILHAIEIAAGTTEKAVK